MVSFNTFANAKVYLFNGALNTIAPAAKAKANWELYLLVTQTNLTALIIVNGFHYILILILIFFI